MAFTLHPATLEDAPALTTIFERAFANDVVMGRMSRDVDPVVHYERDLKYFQGLLGQGTKWGGRITKAVEEGTGRIVAFSRWTYPVTLTEEQKKDKATLEEKRDPHPPGTNVYITEEFFRQLFAGRKKWIDPETMFFLNILAVDPAYQRRGLGSMLIAPGLEDADKAGARTYIEASSAGLPLYLRHGWVPCDEMVIDLTPIGEEQSLRQKFLMREPGAGKKTSM